MEFKQCRAKAKADPALADNLNMLHNHVCLQIPLKLPAGEVIAHTLTLVSSASSSPAAPPGLTRGEDSPQEDGGCSDRGGPDLRCRGQACALPSAVSCPSVTASPQRTQAPWVLTSGALQRPAALPRGHRSPSGSGRGAPLVHGLGWRL